MSERTEEAWNRLHWFLEFMETQGLITYQSRDLLLGDMEEIKAYAFDWDQPKQKECCCQQEIPAFEGKKQVRSSSYEENPHGLL